MSTCKESNDDGKLLPRRFVWCESVVLCYWDKSKMISWVKMYVKNVWRSYIKLVNYTEVQKQHFRDTIKVSREYLDQGQKDPYLCCLQLSLCHQKRTPCGSLSRETCSNVVHFVLPFLFLYSNIKNNVYYKQRSWKSWVTLWIGLSVVNGQPNSHLPMSTYQCSSNTKGLTPWFNVYLQLLSSSTFNREKMLEMNGRSPNLF